MLSAETLAQYPSDLHDTLKAADADWRELEFSCQHMRRGVLFGPPGTGKSRAAELYGRPSTQTLVRTMITPETSAAEVRGHWIIGPSGTEWRDGPGVFAWRNGARLVFDEIDQAGGDTIPFLHALLDDEAVAAITLADGTTIRPAEGFTCICTMNSDPVSLPQALADRFVVKRHVPFPRPEILETLPKIIRAAAAITLFSSNVPPKLKALHSTRTWVEIGHLISKKGLSLTDALRAVNATASLKAITA